MLKTCKITFSCAFMVLDVVVSVIFEMLPADFVNLGNLF